MTPFAWASLGFAVGALATYGAIWLCFLAEYLRFRGGRP